MHRRGELVTEIVRALVIHTTDTIESNRYVSLVLVIHIAAPHDARYHARIPISWSVECPPPSYAFVSSLHL
jgi:hypothetical protein